MPHLARLSLARQKNILNACTDPRKSLHWKMRKYLLRNSASRGSYRAGNRRILKLSQKWSRPATSPLLFAKTGDWYTDSSGRVKLENRWLRAKFCVSLLMVFGHFFQKTKTRKSEFSPLFAHRSSKLFAPLLPSLGPTFAAEPKNRT